MRKIHKIILVVAIALIGGGALLASGAWVSVGFDTSRLSSVGYDWHRTVRDLDAESDAPHERIVITSRFENVRIERTQGDAIELEYWTSEIQDVAIADADGVLTVDCTTSLKKGMLFVLPRPLGRQSEDTATVIRIPSSFTGSIEVDAGSSDVFAQNLNGLERLAVSNRNGSITLHDIEAATVDAHNENGDTLLSAIKGGNLGATNRNGDISLGGADLRVASLENRNGDIMLANIALSETLACHSVNGDISAQKLDIPTSNVESANGDIYLSLLGDEHAYRIRAHSKLGDVDAPRGGGDAAVRSVNVDSHLGDITVDFPIEP